MKLSKHPRDMSAKEWDKLIQSVLFNAGCTCLIVVIVTMWSLVLIVHAVSRWIL